MELVRDGREDQRSRNGPEVVACPAEAYHAEEAPLVFAHADFLDVVVEDLGFSFKDGVCCSFWEGGGAEIGTGF